MTPTTSSSSSSCATGSAFSCSSYRCDTAIYSIMPLCDSNIRGARENKAPVGLQSIHRHLQIPGETVGSFAIVLADQLGCRRPCAILTSRRAEGWRAQHRLCAITRVHELCQGLQKGLWRAVSITKYLLQQKLQSVSFLIASVSPGALARDLAARHLSFEPINLLNCSWVRNKSSR